MKRILCLLLGVICFASVGLAEDADTLVPAAESALSARDFKKAVELSDKAAQANPKNAIAFYINGLAHLGLKQPTEAIKAFTAVLKLDPNRANALDRRGDAYLKAGKFPEAVADFDAFLKLKPELAADHWRRGIALYYAGQYADGVKQFEEHRKVNPEDVENSAWHYLCNARAKTPKEARAALIPVTADSRVPMKQVLELFAGKVTPEEVIAAAEAAKLGDEQRKEARFYARLYVGLYYESEGDDKKAFQYLTEAVEKYPIGHYMWDVGNAHLQVLKAAKK